MARYLDRQALETHNKHADDVISGSEDDCDDGKLSDEISVTPGSALMREIQPKRKLSFF